MTEQSAITMAEYRQKRVGAALRMLLNLLLQDEVSQSDFELTAVNLSSGLNEAEREMLVHLLISSMPADTAESVCRQAFRGAGYPTPALMDDALSEARFWALDANSKELGAYAMACVEQMSTERRAAFLKWALADHD